MKLSDVKEALGIANDLHINFAMCAAHGRGKTAIVQEYAQEHGFDLLTIILSTMRPEDMIGLPSTKVVNGEEVTTFSSPDWLVHACDNSKKTLLFFDEFNNAEDDVQASILNLIQSREANGMRLADTTQIVACFNPTSIAPNAHILAKATRDRFCIVPLSDTQSLDSYVDYYTTNRMEELAKIVSRMDDVVPNYDEETQECAYENAEPTFRSLEAAFKIVQHGIEHKDNELITKQLVMGFCGRAGKQLYTALVDEFNSKESTNGMAEAYSANGVDGLNSYLKDNQATLLSDYATCKNTASRIASIVKPQELMPVLRQNFTDEFLNSYDLV